MISLLPRVQAHTPEIVKRQALVLLFRATASAFRCKMPRLRGLSWEQCLLEYAHFTTAQARDVLSSGRDLSELQERLYGNAYRLGWTTGWLLGAHSVDDAMVLDRFLYGILDIDFYGSGSGEIIISRCYFSSFYSPQLCQLMSAMDHGLLAGLAGAAGRSRSTELVFTERITEGRPCCRARFMLAGSASSAQFAQEQMR